MLQETRQQDIHSPRYLRQLTSRLRNASFSFYDRYEYEFFSRSVSSEHDAESQRYVKYDQFYKDFITAILGTFIPQLKVQHFNMLGRSTQAVAVVAYVQATKELLVQLPSFSNKIGLVKGKIEEGETCLEAAERELYEEAGISLDLATMHSEHLLRQRCVLVHDQLIYMVQILFPYALSDLRPLSSSEVRKAYFTDIREINFAQAFGVWTSEAAVGALAVLLGLKVVRNTGPGNEITELRLTAGK